MLEKLKFLFKKEKDVTSGNIAKNVIALAAPMMIGAILANMQSLIDMFWVGSLGANSISAVAISSIVLMFVFTLSMGIGIGTLSLVAKSIGAKDTESASAVAAQAMFLTVLLSVSVAVAGYFFSAKFLAWLGADAAVVKVGASYLRISLLGSVTILVLLTGNYILQAAGDVVNPMIFLALANIFNIILDPIFIFGIGVPAMGVSGAALATVLSQAMSMTLLMRLLHRDGCKVRLEYGAPFIRTGIIKDIFKIGIPSSLQMFFRTTSYMVIVSLVALFGMKAVAAFGIVVRLQVTILMPSFALGGAAATFMGQNLGACNPERARKSAWAATWFDFVILAFASVLFFIFARPLVAIFSSDAALLDMGAEFLRIASFFYVFIAFGVVLNRGLGGAGDTLVPMLITFLSLWVYMIPASYILSTQTSLGVAGIWWAMATSYAVNGILTILWFESGAWKGKQVVK